MLQQQQRRNKQSIKQESRGPRLRSCPGAPFLVSTLDRTLKVVCQEPPLKTPLQPARPPRCLRGKVTAAWREARLAPELRSRPGFSSCSTLAWLRVGEVVVVGGCRRSPGAEEAS